MSKIIDVINLSKSVQLPIFEKPEITYLSSFEIVEHCESVLKKRMAETKYDRLVIAEQFLDHFFEKKNTDPSVSPLETFQSFLISNSLEKNQGNSCVALTLDLMDKLNDGIKAFPAGAILSNIYQQFAGPKYSHVTPLIKFENPNDKQDKGYVLLDPSFHIHKPVLVIKNSKDEFKYDMGEKKGVWHFYISDEFIHCQPKSLTLKWDNKRLEDSLMVYRTDKLLNPVQSSSNPMFAIDRNYPVVSRYGNGKQKAHVNVNLHEKNIAWKKENETKSFISFDDFLSGYRFESDLTDQLFLNNKSFNESLYYVISNANIFDSLYIGFVNFLKINKYYLDIVKDPKSLLENLN